MGDDETKARPAQSLEAAGRSAAPSPAAKDASADARREAARLMGSVRSEAKAAAVRENGKLGGRPRGQKMSDEAKARIAEAARQRWAAKKAAEQKDGQP